MDDAEVSSGIMVIYTGGTIGSMPRDDADPFSPLVPKSVEAIFGRMNEIQQLTDQRYKIDLGIGGRKTKVELQTHSFQQPIDSTNITIESWVTICELIHRNYAAVDGFVILHGTDTLSYSASCIAFMLQGLTKPVVFTGAQLPIGATRNDAKRNLITAIEVAAAKKLGNPIVPEVSVLFDNYLFRGCRIRKLSASSFHGFGTPNMDPLGEVGEHIKIRRQLVRATSETKQLKVSSAPVAEVVSLDVFPGMKPGLLRSALENCRGAVIKSFGTGNIPTIRSPGEQDSLIDVLAAPENRQKIIVNVSQCIQGEVEQGLYDVSAGLASCGVISGFDMTDEAALTKLMVVLAQQDELGLSVRDAKDLMQINLRGEQRVSCYNLYFQTEGKLDAVASKHNLPAATKLRDQLSLIQDQPFVTGVRHGAAKYHHERVAKVYLELIGIRSEPDKSLDFVIQLPPQVEQDARRANPVPLAHVQKTPEKREGINTVFDVTSQVVDIVQPDTLVRLELCNLDPDRSEVTIEEVRIVVHAIG